MKKGSSALSTEMEGVLYEMSKSKLLSAEICDSVEAEFKTMVRNAKTYQKEEVASFDIKKDRLESFYSEFLLYLSSFHIYGSS